MSDETKDQFTPGPWTIVSTPDSRGNLWVDSAKTVVASVQDHYQNKPELVAANAKLIHASPDMLAALVLCVENYEDGLVETDAWQMLHIGKVERPPTPYHIMAARAAIAKAREG